MNNQNAGNSGTTGELLTAMGTPRGMPGVLEFPCTATRLSSGNTLIVDAGDETGAGSEIIEVDPRGQIVWNYGSLRFAHSAVRTRAGNVLVADTTNDRVIEIAPDASLVFSTDDLGGGTGGLSDGSHLAYPNCARELPGGDLLITDRNNNRCLILARNGDVRWQCSEGIEHPHNAEMLESGNILVADSDANRIVELAPDKSVAWSYGDGSERMLHWPRHACRLDGGNTLITDSKNSRVIEVSGTGEIVWQYQVDYFAKFYYGEKLPNGNVLIADQQGHRVFEVDLAGTIVWQFRNYIYPNPIHPRLQNGSFKARAENGWPEGWILATRLSEGGGQVIWDKRATGRPCPGLQYNRPGALCLQQTIRAATGKTYHMAGQIRTESLDGYACFQLAFVDDLGAAIHDAPDIPRGQVLSKTTDWTQDSFQAAAPHRAVALEVRLFVTGTGKAWMKGVLVHT